MAYAEQFTDEERKQLAEANAIRAKVKAARRARQKQHEEDLKLAATRRAMEDDKEKIRLAKEKAARKLDFDNRIRKVLLDLTYKMKDEGVHLITNPLLRATWPYGDAGRKVKVFTMVDAKGNEKATDIYWVYGKGFEWE